jgi:hypothetical protein
MSTLLNFLTLAGWTFALVTCGHTEEPVNDPKLVRVSYFPEVLQENSGMTEYADLLWNINDGGNEAAVFGFNAIDTVVDQKIIIKGAVNTDWEDITQDEQHLYIGDFGNNLGSRQDLRIYILNKTDILPSSDSLPVAGMINFSYEDQTDFTPAANYTTPWDCEAFVVVEESVILFTKNWESNETSLYTLPARPGTFVAKFRKRYDVNGLVTAAAYSKAKKELMLLGYDNFTPFISVVSDFGMNNFSFSQVRKIIFPEMQGTQTEGLAYSNDGSVYVSSEQSPFLNQKPTIFRVEF